MDPQYKPTLLKTTSEMGTRLYKLNFDMQYFMSVFYSLHHNLPLKIGYKHADCRIYYFFFMSKRQVPQVIGYPVLFNFDLNASTTFHGVSNVGQMVW
jgi:hypothetical protein